MNSYELSRKFWDWAFDNPEKVKPIHSAIYFFSIEHCNRLGWKQKFGLPSQMVMEAIGVKNWKTYSAGLNDLIEYGFIEMIEKSKNQYSSNIIAIVNFTKAPTKALDKALSEHSQKHSPKQGQSTVSVDKQLNNKTNKQPKIDFDFEVYLKKLNELFGKNHKVVTTKLKEKVNARLKQGFTKENFWIAMQNVKKNQYHIDNNFEYVNPLFFAQEEKLTKYGDQLRKGGSNTYQLID